MTNPLEPPSQSELRRSDSVGGPGTEPFHYLLVAGGADKPAPDWSDHLAFIAPMTLLLLSSYRAVAGSHPIRALAICNFALPFFVWPFLIWQRRRRKKMTERLQ